MDQITTRYLILAFLFYIAMGCGRRYGVQDANAAATSAVGQSVQKASASGSQAQVSMQSRNVCKLEAREWTQTLDFCKG